MTDPATLAVAHADDRQQANVIDVLRAALKAAEDGEFETALVVATCAQTDETYFASSGFHDLTQTVGALERLKHDLLTRNDS